MTTAARIQVGQRRPSWVSRAISRLSRTIEVNAASSRRAQERVGQTCSASRHHSANVRRSGRSHRPRHPRAPGRVAQRGLRSATARALASERGLPEGGGRLRRHLPRARWRFLGRAGSPPRARHPRRSLRPRTHVNLARSPDRRAESRSRRRQGVVERERRRARSPATAHTRRPTQQGVAPLSPARPETR